MNIEDILKSENIEGKKISIDFFIDEMNRTLGKNDVVKLTYLLGSTENALRWYYSNNKNFGNIRPYDCSIGGKKREVVNLINSIWYGDFS